MNDLFPTLVREGEGNPIWLAYSLYETKLQNSTVSVFKMESPPNTVLAPPHKHPFDELLIVLRGKVVSSVGYPAQDYVLQPGDMIFLPAGVLEGFSTLDERAEMLWLMFDDKGTSEDFFLRNGMLAWFRQLPPPGWYQAPEHSQTQRFAEDTGFAEVPDL